MEYYAVINKNKIFMCVMISNCPEDILLNGWEEGIKDDKWRNGVLAFVRKIHRIVLKEHAKS